MLIFSVTLVINVFWVSFFKEKGVPSLKVSWCILFISNEVYSLNPLVGQSTSIESTFFDAPRPK